MELGTLDGLGRSFNCPGKSFNGLYFIFILDPSSRLIVIVKCFIKILLWLDSR
jgi:hypothetical protein